MFQEKDVRKDLLDPVAAFGKDWMALTAGNEERGYNTMTIAWGHTGALWERESHRNVLPTLICYVRPGRYTKKFMDREEFFTVSHFKEEQRKTLGYLGSHSGRDGDKIKEAGLTPVFSDDTTYFAEADTVYICRKLYQAPLLEEGFVDREVVDFNYPEKDFHEVYVGEIVKVLKKEEKLDKSANL